MLQEYDNVEINEDIIELFVICLCFPGLSIGVVSLHGVLHPFPHFTIDHSLVAFRLAFCIVPRLAICLEFWDGGVCCVCACAYVPTQPQKKVILDLFQLFDLSDVLITVLREVSIGVR